jgi:hypothetical protein
MATKAAPIIGGSRPAGDVLWFAFTAIVCTVISLIACWPLSTRLLARNTAVAATDEPTADPIPGTVTGPAATAALPIIVSGDRITRPGALLTRGDEGSGGSSNVVPRSVIAVPTEQSGASPTLPERALPAAPSASRPTTARNPGVHRARKHKPGPWPVASAQARQLTPW